MEWFNSLFVEHTPLQAIVILSIIIAGGLYLGKIKVYGVSLGVTFVFFMGILMGHFGLSIDRQMLVYAEDFGLVLFVYELGLQVGPGFFSSFKKGGLRLNMLSISLVFLGTALAIALSYLIHIPMSEMVGILCGATTNTPALGAAQQTLAQMNMDSVNAALSCAVSYPLGVIGVILAMIVIRKLFVRPVDIASMDQEEQNETFIATFRVHNPAVFDKSIKEVAQISGRHFVISRLWRNGKVTIPHSDMKLECDDRLLVVTTPEDISNLTLTFGMEETENWNKKDIDWNAIDSQLISKHIVISKPEINGKKLGTLKLRNNYDINITRVMRSGIQLLATPGLILQLGDRLTVVGERQAVENVEKVLGNKVRPLKDPNLAIVFIGIILGLIIGTIPVAIPGISQPVKLGLAGGPIVVGILIGRFGPRFHLITYTTRSANLMLRGLGIALYLACLGLDSGAHFFETVIRPEGAIWIGAGFLITVLPVVIMGIVSLRISRIDFGNTCGMLCGSMANPMALGYAHDIIPSDSPAVSYATVYPLSMFARVIIAQLLVMIFA
ncbi:putative transporter [Phocaeicola abscessus]|uniref:putative transporter n=1 Tax=Phocaeicola abscessus TaxID=555313 RepID=UPI0028E86510|nr:putative transporter [Phocaeicola abscessus]